MDGEKQTKPPVKRGCVGVKAPRRSHGHPIRRVVFKSKTVKMEGEEPESSGRKMPRSFALRRRGSKEYHRRWGSQEKEQAQRGKLGGGRNQNCSLPRDHARQAGFGGKQKESRKVEVGEERRRPFRGSHRASERIQRKADIKPRRLSNGSCSETGEEIATKKKT